MRISAGSLTRSALLSPRHVEADGGDEDGAFDDVLRRALDGEERHAVVETRHHERAEEGAGDLAASTHQARTADHARSDGIERSERAGVRRCTADTAGVE